MTVSATGADRQDLTPPPPPGRRLQMTNDQSQTTSSRLRALYPTHPIIMEAADEIERLRDGLTEILEAIDTGEVSPHPRSPGREMVTILRNSDAIKFASECS